MSNEYKDWMVEELKEANRLLEEAAKYLQYAAPEYQRILAKTIMEFLLKEKNDNRS